MCAIVIFEYKMNEFSNPTIELLSKTEDIPFNDRRSLKNKRREVNFKNQ